ncbi:MAG: hypothetical protein ACI4NP_02770 [Thermoguttaceae bacterium]
MPVVRNRRVARSIMRGSSSSLPATVTNIVYQGVRLEPSYR